MKTRNLKNRDFSNQFDHITLDDIFQKERQKESNKGMLNKTPSIITRKNDYGTWADSCDSYIQRMLELDPIVPNRYVWHVTYPCCDGIYNLRSFAIASDGLKVRYSRCGGAICAHNRLYSISDFYPFIIDYDAFTDSFGGIQAPSSRVLYSDFWRIDTHAYKGKWYIDPNMKDDCSIYSNTYPVNYLCTPEDVPAHALKLYKLSIDVFLNNYQRLGEPNFSLLSLSLLRPDNKVNEWVLRKRNAA